MGPEHVTGQMLLLAHKTLGHLVVIVTGVGIFAAIDFNHTITLGSVLIAFIVIAVSGVFTVRSRIATIWRQEAEGERAARERLEEELAEEKLGRAKDLAEEKISRAEFEREQQEIRHDLKGEIAQCKAQLKVMEAKTDLTGALEAIRQMNENAVATISASISEIFVERSKEEHARTHELLQEIRDKLPSEPFAVDVIHDLDHTD